MEPVVGVVTVYDLNNYGNRLQNYAVHKLLYKLGFVAVNDIVMTHVQKKAQLRMFMMPILFGVRRKKAKRDKIFAIFSKTYMPNKKKHKQDFSFSICGSDQIWHPVWYGDDHMFLMNIPKQKRVSFSASFGVSSIPEERKEEYAKKLSEMKAISVREESGARIIKELTGRDVPVLLDPTLMLDKQEWQEIEEKPKYAVPEKYLLTYFLGDISPERNEYIKRIAHKNNLSIIRLEAHNPTDEWYKAGPAEFVWLVEHCALLCTDSFHGSVFSVLLEVPFLVFSRKDKVGDISSRLDTLLSKLKLENRKFANQQGEVVFWKDYRHIPAVLVKERKKAIDFLRNAMDLANEN